MGREGISKQDVYNAINTIIIQKQIPTIQRVRDILGTGSNTTISRHLAEWKGKPKKNKPEEEVSIVSMSESAQFRAGFNMALNMMKQWANLNKM